MTDRTIIICACLVIVAVLLFAGTGLLLMYKGNPVQGPSGGSFQQNDEQMEGPNQDSSWAPNNQPVHGQGMINEKGTSAAQSGSRNDATPGVKMQSQSGSGFDQQRSSWMGPSDNCPCSHMRGNSVGRSAPDGFARQESLGGQSDARERYSGSGNRESPGLSVPNGFGRQETVGGQPGAQGWYDPKDSTTERSDRFSPQNEGQNVRVYLVVVQGPINSA